MNLKRYLPLITLLLVSIAVVACALAAVYVLSVDAKTTAEKTQSSLRLGGPFALGLIVLLWFGAGMDQILSRLKQKSTRITVSLATYLVLPVVLCIGLPALVAFLIYGGIAAPTGWRELPAPPQPAVEVAAASELSVIIRTDTGSYYSCVASSPSTCWEFALEPEARMTGRGTELTTPPTLDPPGNAISILGLSYTDLGEEGQVYYVVLEDGSVWVLRKDANSYEAGFASGLFLTLAIIPALAGLLVIYLGAGLSALTRRIAS